MAVGGEIGRERGDALKEVLSWAPKSRTTGFLRLSSAAAHARRQDGFKQTVAKSHGSLLNSWFAVVDRRQTLFTSMQLPLVLTSLSNTISEALLSLFRFRV